MLDYVDEPATPDRWQDVSAECEIGEEPSFCYLSHERISRWQTTSWAKDYRLRRVQIGSIITGDREVLTGHEQVRLASTEPQWAFLVEKKVSE
jgi:hypothetical protein